MKVNHILKGITLMGLMLSVNAFAQEETEVKSKTTFSGNFDGYYKFDSNAGIGGNHTSFTKSHRSFQLGMASIKAEHQIGKVGAVIDLGFGQRVEEFTYADTNPTSRYIKQAYLTYQVCNSITVTGGTFATHFGYELVDASSNRNYSMSYAFSYGPFLNTGIKANYVMDDFNFMLGATLPTDYRKASDAGTGQKTLIGQVGFTGDERSVYFNFSADSYSTSNTAATKFDLVVTQKFDDKLSVDLNAIYNMQSTPKISGHKHWYSTAVYLKYDHKENLNFTYRGELFGDRENLAGVNTHILANTVSLNYKIGNLTIIPELRGDLANSPVFTLNDSKSRLNAYALIAATYKF